ncbi:M23 family metallopeptidase [Cryobacterium adonitolivorans]|uniref:M23 family metallopeptidase n=1 Tax=Cryobacterium adonitolivorans TaxID=1259189 RepID=A0A4R8WAT4_9MICO|nr:M23 family metallopeptidase [Cryobacterium adonitolivorans]TFC05635.1 M23 family metallopeptidase [Cryobacterium adonitolivorans]
MRRRSGFIAPPSRRRQATAVTAMTFVALLTAAGALPAQAAYVDADGAAASAANASVASRFQPAAAPEQSVTVSAQAPVAVQVDTFAAEEVAPPPPVVVAPAAAAAPAAVAAAPTGASVRWPFPGSIRISDGYGPRSAPCAGCSTFHDGLDMNPGEGTPIGSIADGVVSSVTAFDDGGLGVHVMIDHVVDGQNVTSTYAHMRAGSAAVSVGQSVTAGQVIGNVGSTGQSTGPHLHLELHLDGVTAIDPFGWLTEHAGPM